MGDIKDFKFPADFGFTGSAGRSTIREHSRGPRRFAEGGQVKTSPPPDLKPGQKDTPKPKPTRDTVQVPKVGSTADTLKNLRERQMKELGLKRGGKVRRAGGGSVRTSDQPLAMRSDPDDVTAPAAKKGGQIRRAMGGPVGYKKGGKPRC